MPNRPKPHITMATMPPVKTRSREQRQVDHRLRRAALDDDERGRGDGATAKLPRISAEVQPLSWPSISA